MFVDGSISKAMLLVQETKVMLVPDLTKLLIILTGLNHLSIRIKSNVQLSQMAIYPSLGLFNCL